MWKFHKSVGDGVEGGESDAKNRGWTRKAVLWIERILLVSGLALAGFYAGAGIESYLSSRAALRKFSALEMPADVSSVSREENSQPTNELRSGPMDLPAVDFSLWGEQRIRTYKQTARNMSGVPLAVLRIPKIRLEAPLFDGTDDITLNHAVGRIAGTARPGEPGNMGIAGHRDGFFRGLKDIGVGDAIELKTLEGTETYIVDDIKIVSPRQVEVLRARSIPSLTLVTCYPFYFLGSAPQRYIVTASLLPEINGAVENSKLDRPWAANNSIRR